MRSSHFRTGKWSQSSNGDSPLHPVPFLQQRVAPLLPTDPAAPCNRARVQGKKKKSFRQKRGLHLGNVRIRNFYFANTMGAHFAGNNFQVFWHQKSVLGALHMPRQVAKPSSAGSGGTGTCGCSIRFRQMLGSARRHCRPDTGGLSLAARGSASASSNG